MVQSAFLALPLMAVLATTGFAPRTHSASGRPTITAEDVTVVEGQPAVLTLTLSEPSADYVFGTYRTVGGSARDGEDYAAGAGLVFFNPGQTVTTIVIPTYDDFVTEGPEVFMVHLHAKGASTPGGLVKVTILDLL